MANNSFSDKLINQLQERAKELNCLYEIQELLSNKNKSTDEVLAEIIQVIPYGWQFPDVCTAKIFFEGSVFKSSNFEKSEWLLESDISAQDDILGKIQVQYTEERPECDYGPFLKEEKKLIRTISELIGSYLLHVKLKSVFDANLLKTGQKRLGWINIIFILKQTDPKLLIRVSQKMVNYLCWKGISDSEKLFDLFSIQQANQLDTQKESNFPYQVKPLNELILNCNKIFDFANRHLGEQEIIDNISRWIRQDQSGFLVNIINDTGSSFEDIIAVLERFHHLKTQGLILSPIREKNLRVILIGRLLSSQKKFIQIAKSFIKLDDFHDIVRHIIHPIESHGKLGGKGAQLLLSEHILNKSELSDQKAKRFRVPKTWYITSDGVLKFIENNNLEDIVEQKYKGLEQIRKEYTFISQVFKNSTFPSEIVKGLKSILDEVPKTPLVIRSTSLLEDREHSIFAGKYKSLFISNQGSKEERLNELTDAIAEVYASTFGPDPIEYRIEKDLLDYNEEMGILIQEVVGRQVGPYFFPSFAGVAFSDNNYRWSARIEKEDGLIRLVPGLGTRAVDRVSDDYPVLIAPGKPNLRTNVTLDEIAKYSPKMIDVINLEKRRFETISIRNLIKEHGDDYPAIDKLVSVIKTDYIYQPNRFGMDFEKDSYVVTFSGLIEQTDFIPNIRSMMFVLEKEFGYPIDIEFAHDGDDFYLLQCRPQGYGKTGIPAEIPNDIPDDQLIFSAHKHVTNGSVRNITHLVYVDPTGYGNLEAYNDLVAVGTTVGRLNKLLPKKQFILMGPGRWGSRGDIKLGVSISYSDINNTAMLIEIARKQRDYVPELSFGTHFFQDLVEADILYLPLYPDNKENVFNKTFFLNSYNILPDLFPDLNRLSDVIKVIDVKSIAGGKVIDILLNSEESKAVAILANPAEIPESPVTIKPVENKVMQTDFHWRWRLGVAEQIASKIDPVRFGIKGFYIFGSTKNATAKQSSDIDLLIHFNGDKKQHNELLIWLEGWEKSLEYDYYLKTGYKIKTLLDVHIVTDEDIKNKTSFAIKIGAITDAARPLPIGTEL
jgi:predicted nucleotidyltransferase